jgi:hypothetical protein
VSSLAATDEHSQFKLQDASPALRAACRLCATTITRRRAKASQGSYGALPVSVRLVGAHCARACRHTDMPAQLTKHAQTHATADRSRTHRCTTPADAEPAASQFCSTTTCFTAPCAYDVAQACANTVEPWSATTTSAAQRTVALANSGLWDLRPAHARAAMPAPAPSHSARLRSAHSHSTGGAHLRPHSPSLPARAQRPPAVRGERERAGNTLHVARQHLRAPAPSPAAHTQPPSMRGAAALGDSVQPLPACLPQPSAGPAACSEHGARLLTTLHTGGWPRACVSTGGHLSVTEPPAQHSTQWCAPTAACGTCGPPLPARPCRPQPQATVLACALLTRTAPAGRTCVPTLPAPQHERSAHLLRVSPPHRSHWPHPHPLFGAAALHCCTPA